MLWFTADTHFGHKMILTHCKRPFATIEEHDDELIKRWNDVVGPEDTVYHLGDFAYRASTPYVQSVIRRLHGGLVLVPGGHDFTRANRRAWSRETNIEVGTRHPLVHIEQDGVTYVLCHWPMHTWWKRRHGAKHLHGHCHQTLPVPEYFNGHVGRIDVGVDAWEYRPVSVNQILNCPDLMPGDDS